MKTALFHNFTSTDFKGYWDGKPKTFKAGQQVMMPLYLAEHYAKHLANSVLIGKGQYSCTSPKFPLQVPQFMELFNQACIVQEDEEDKTEAEVEMEVANQHPSMNINTKGKEPQIVLPPKEDDEDDESKGEDFQT